MLEDIYIQDNNNPQLEHVSHGCFRSHFSLFSQRGMQGSAEITLLSASAQSARQLRFVPPSTGTGR